MHPSHTPHPHGCDIYVWSQVTVYTNPQSCNIHDFHALICQQLTSAVLKSKELTHHHLSKERQLEYFGKKLKIFMLHICQCYLVLNPKTVKQTKLLKGFHASFAVSIS